MQESGRDPFDVLSLLIENIKLTRELEKRVEELERKSNVNELYKKSPVRETPPVDASQQNNQNALTKYLKHTYCGNITINAYYSFTHMKTVVDELKQLMQKFQLCNNLEGTLYIEFASGRPTIKVAQPYLVGDKNKSFIFVCLVPPNTNWGDVEEFAQKKGYDYGMTLSLNDRMDGLNTRKASGELGKLAYELLRSKDY